MSKAASANGSGPGGAWTKSARSDRPRFAPRAARRLDHRQLDIEAGRMGGTMLLDQMQRDAAGAAADVEDRLALKRQAFEHPVDLVRPARRQIAVAPQRLQEADGGVVIFRRGVGRFDHRMLSLPSSKSRAKPSASQENATSFVEHSFNMAGQNAGCAVRKFGANGEVDGKT